ncbi:hypothetical protein DdX_08839 [Ditylenchus destructor]|uniref:Uncharacterized protein n=1 Tax=Ditylenchus destructor TaxID=166010 RepID=A0AAD4N519_9BILA|nr:hypothetical protein DdX_08839 [Ditylenchus destructor]
MAAQNPTVNDKETTAGEIPIEVELCFDDQVKKCLESAIKHKEDHAPNTGSMVTNDSENATPSDDNYHASGELRSTDASSNNSSSSDISLPRAIGSHIPAIRTPISTTTSECDSSGTSNSTSSSISSCTYSTVSSDISTNASRTDESIQAEQTTDLTNILTDTSSISSCSIKVPSNLSRWDLEKSDSQGDISTANEDDHASQKERKNKTDNKSKKQRAKAIGLIVDD